MKFLDTLDRWIGRALTIIARNMMRPSIILIIFIILFIFTRL